MGITFETIVKGDGKNFPKAGDHVTLEYIGKLVDGTVFDDTYAPGQPPLITPIGTGGVIRALDEGVVQLSLGQKAILTASPDICYGTRGFPPVIPANAALRLEVRLLKIN